MIDPDELKVGDKVHYQPPHFCDYQAENGIVKEVRGRTVFVVYNCNDDWKNFQNYTGANTLTSHLFRGWK